jgi:hypothetical protein
MVIEKKLSCGGTLTVESGPNGGFYVFVRDRASFANSSRFIDHNFTEEIAQSKSVRLYVLGDKKTLYEILGVLHEMIREVWANETS